MLNYNSGSFSIRNSVPCLRRIFAGFTPCKPRFDSSSIHARFVVDRVVERKDFLRVFLLYPASIILPLIHTHLHLHVFLIRSTNGRSLWTLQKATLIKKSGSIVQKSAFTSVRLNRLNTARGVDWFNLTKDGNQWWAFVNSVMNLRITDMVEYISTIFATIDFSGSSYRGDGNAYFPTIITRSSSDANTWTEGRNYNRPIRHSWRAVAVTFLRNLNSGWLASRRNKINYREFEGISYKPKRNTYTAGCRQIRPAWPLLGNWR